MEQSVRHCSNCGHPLGIGRFCTNCGHPVDEAAQTAIRNVAPPPPPSGSRFPLFADEVDEPRPEPWPEPAPMAPPTLAPPTPPTRHSHRRRNLLPWVMGLAILLLLAVIGVALFLRQDGGTTPAAGPATDPGNGTRSGPDRSDRPGDARPPGDPVDLTRDLRVQAPPAAPPNQDVDGNQVRYVAANMLDGVPETCWRTPGDATGATLTLSLPEAVRVTEVGLVNGYAKVATDGSSTFDWYRGNRRITSVEWTFDDGTTVSQDLRPTTRMQTVPVEEVSTATIELRLVAVTPPGQGRSSRDYTAISDLSVTGVDRS